MMHMSDDKEKLDEKAANIPILSGEELQEIRHVIAKAKNADLEAARVEYNERLCSLQSEAFWTFKRLLDKCKALKEYRDAEYVGHKRSNTILMLPGGRAIGFGWADHMSGAAGYFQKTFEFWGFAGPWELYSLPSHFRNEFFDKSTKFVESIFGKDAAGLEKLLNTVDGEEDLVQLKLLQLKGEDLTSETRMALTAIACSIKQRLKQMSDGVCTSGQGKG
jgi:hypothetical protein